jgi:hypothetical protein
MIGLGMARANLPAKKYKKSNPTQIRLSFEANGEATEFIDIAMALSAINRKFYRQGVYYYVNSVEVYNDETGVVDLHTLPDTWVTKNAWSRGFQLYQKMNSMTDTPVSNISRPKYHDFKVYMSTRHKSTGTLLPSMHNINNAASTISVDEWEHSRFVSADDDGDAAQEADDFTVHMIGTHTGNSDNWESVGLIKSYAESRVTVLPSTDENATNVDVSDPLINVFDMSSEEQMNDIIENLVTANDEPPYDFNSYVGEGNQFQHVARLGTEQGVGRVARASGFCAPLGLIMVDPFGIRTSYRVVINLAPGTYHGVYAERV